MSFINNIKLKPKLIGGFLGAALLPIIIILIIATTQVEKAMMHDAFAQLQAVQKIKQAQISNFFNERKSDIEVLAQNSDALEMFHAMTAYAERMNTDNQGPLNVSTQEHAEICSNTNGKRLKYFMESYGYYDIFIIDWEYGHVMYTVAKESDLGENLSAGSLRSSGLGKAWQAAKEQHGTVLIDFEPYAPSFGAPASFLATPLISKDGQAVGVLALQIPLDAIDAIMQERDGMGKTGETYLVGSDYRMRSDSYLDPKGHSVNASFAGTVKANGVDTEATRRAFSGQPGEDVVIDYNGNPVLSVYDPLKVMGLHWAILAEIDLAEVKEPINKLVMTVLISSMIIGIVIVILAIAVAINIARPIQRASALALQLADKDLTIEPLRFDFKDEVGDLGRALDDMSDSLKQIILQVRSNAFEVSSASSEISATASQMAAGAEEASSQTTEVAASVQEMSAAILENSQNAVDTSNIAAKATDKAREGARSMETTQQDMHAIVDSARKTAQIVESLASRAEQIDSIIQVIDDIADQTNLLALNAAIEAARAGEQGRGFAVVADEVRKLAERTTRATGEIGETIKAIQDDTQSAASSMSEANTVVGQGQESIKQTSYILTEIIDGVQEAMEMIQQIATASEEQSRTAESISKNVDAISTVADQSASGAEELAATAEQLNQQTESLRRLVELFRTDN